ncbi:hypothetical protein HMPREF3156_00235 [Neisseria sp. HMSC06F02]|nr:hypothetical protein HMPREF3156_00235 [Neisseria sp. HMSC06F02]
MTRLWNKGFSVSVYSGLTVTSATILMFDINLSCRFCFQTTYRVV